MLNRQGRPTEPGAAGPSARRASARDLHGQSRAAHRGGADLRDRPARGERRRSRRAGRLRAALGRPDAHRADRPAGPERTGDSAPLRAALAHQLQHRFRHLSARLLHHEAQPAPQREDGAAAGLRRRPSAAAVVDRVRCARADRRTRPLADRAHRHAGGRAVAQGRRARRVVRHDGNQGGAGGARRAPLGGAGAGVGARHQSGDRRAARLPGRGGAGGRRRDGRGGRGAQAPLGRRRRAHAHQSQYVRPVRARHRRNRRRGACGRSVRLRRRRQLQRRHGQGAAGRSRRRCHASEPAQDVLDPARRRRTGRRPGDVLRGAETIHAGALFRSRRRGLALCRARRRRCRRRAAVRPPVRVPRPDGHVRARARLHAVARRRRPAAGRRGRGAQCQLRACILERSHVAALRRARLHARGAVRRSLARRHRHHHARFRQGDDRRGLSPDDRVLPAGRARRHADRADRIGKQGFARPVRRHAARSRVGRETRRQGAFRGGAALRPAPPPRRDPRGAPAGAAVDAEERSP